MLKKSLKTCSVIFLLLFLWAVSLQAAYCIPQKGDRLYYSIKWQDKIIGFSAFKLDNRMSLAGKSYYKFVALTKLKVGLGEIEDLEYQIEEEFEIKDLVPTYFSCNQFQKDKTLMSLFCLFSPGMAAQRNVMGKEGNDYITKLSNAGGTYFTNMWGYFDTNILDYYIIIQKIKSLQDGTLTLYDPMKREGITLNFIKQANTTINSQGVNYSCQKFLLTDKDENVRLGLYYYPAQDILIKVENEIQGITLNYSNDRVKEEVAKTKGLDLWEYKTKPSNMFISLPEEMDMINVNIDVDVRGINIINHKTLNFEQTFITSKEEVKEEDKKYDYKLENAENKEPEPIIPEVSPTPVSDNAALGDVFGFNHLKGNITVKSTAFDGKNVWLFPINDEKMSILKEAVPQYLDANVDKKIKLKALELTYNARDAFSAVKKMLRFIDEEIQTGIGLPSAKVTFSNKEGNSIGKALLARDLCRSAGIPARVVGGLLLSSSNFIPHYWLEVMVCDSGWVSIDPTLMETEKISAAHISLFTTGDADLLGISIVNFGPREDLKVSYFRKEITWPLSQERVYSIYRQGEPIGTDSYYLKGLEMIGDNECYQFVGHRVTEDANIVEKINTTLFITPFGLPVSYSIDYPKADKAMLEEYSFNQDLVHEKISFDDKSIERDIPISDGSYMGDMRAVGYLSLVMGQLPSYSEGTSYNFHIFSPELLKSEAWKCTIKTKELVAIRDKQILAYMIETSYGLTFWVDENRVTIKIDIPDEDEELILQETKNHI